MSKDRAIRVILCVATTFLIGFLGAASPTSAPATTTMPATAATTLPTNVLRSGDHQAAFEIRQDDQTIKLDATNLYHLRAAPFSIHVTGDVDDVAVANAHTDTLIKALSAEKRPVVYMTATSAACALGDLFINDQSALTPWDTFKITFGDEAEKSTKIFAEKLGQLPVIIDSSIQFLAAFKSEDSHDCSFQISNLFQTDGLLFNYSNRNDLTNSHAPVRKLDWAKESEIFMVIFIISPVDESKHFEKIDWKGVHLKFDKK